MSNPKQETVNIFDEIRKIAAADDAYPELTLEATVMLLLTERLHKLKADAEKELKALTEGQKKVTTLHELLKKINALTNKGELNLEKNKEAQAEIKKLLKEAKELGVEVDDKKDKYTREERDRLVENIRMTIEDLNVKNDMQLQTVTRLTNERYESYQMARAIMKPLDEAKKSMARGIAGSR